MTSADHQHESTAAEQAGTASGQDVTGAGAPQDTAGPGPREGVAESSGEGMAGDTPTELVADLAKAQEDVATLTGDLQRLQAEYVNYKRRVDRDRELVKQNATFAALSAMLPVLDDIDRAREHGEVEGGFKAVADSLERIVTGLGLEKFGAPGDEFDPNLHEALMHATSPEVSTTVCQNIVHAGYRIGDRVVRPARVTVVGPESEGSADAQQ
ncbi:MAG: nucleotide exchange factor GrpE [Actinomycetota bacterium]